MYSLCLSLVSKAESSDKNLTDIFMNQSGLKSPVSKIGERFQRKLENLRIITQSNACLSVNYQIDVRRTDTQAFKAAWKSSTLVKKAFFTIKLSKFEQRVQISSEFKLNKEWRFRNLRAFILNR